MKKLIKQFLRFLGYRKANNQADIELSNLLIDMNNSIFDLQEKVNELQEELTNHQHCDGSQCDPFPELTKEELDSWNDNDFTPKDEGYNHHVNLDANSDEFNDFMKNWANSENFTVDYNNLNPKFKAVADEVNSNKGNFTQYEEEEMEYLSEEESEILLKAVADHKAKQIENDLAAKEQDRIKKMREFAWLEETEECDCSNCRNSDYPYFEHRFGGDCHCDDCDEDNFEELDEDNFEELDLDNFEEKDLPTNMDLRVQPKDAMDRLMELVESYKGKMPSFSQEDKDRLTKQIVEDLLGDQKKNEEKTEEIKEYLSGFDYKGRVEVDGGLVVENGEMIFAVKYKDMEPKLEKALKKAAKKKVSKKAAKKKTAKKKVTKKRANKHTGETLEEFLAEDEKKVVKKGVKKVAKN